MPNAPARFRAYVPASENAWPQRKKRKRRKRRKRRNRSSDPRPGSTPLRTPPAQADPSAGSRRFFGSHRVQIISLAAHDLIWSVIWSQGRATADLAPLCAPAFKRCCIIVTPAPPGDCARRIDLSRLTTLPGFLLFAALLTPKSDVILGVRGVGRRILPLLCDLPGQRARRALTLPRPSSFPVYRLQADMCPPSGGEGCANEFSEGTEGTLQAVQKRQGSQRALPAF